jgi:exonuclease SbcC
MTDTRTRYKGSEWGKWDLHLHTIYSHTNSRYNCTMKEIADKISAENIEVVGVTNYFIVEEKEIEELRAELGSSVFLIPNFEFRINEKNKDGEYINIHVLFNPHTTTISRIHESLARIELTNISGGSKEYCTLANVKRIGSDKITVSLIELVDQLKKDFNEKDDFLIVGVNKGYGGFCPGGKPRDQELALKIDALSDFIFSKKEDVDFFLNNVSGRKELNLIPKAVVECSDAHSIGDIGRKFSWIKADSSFEGLKQILYEPKHRISIAEEKPREPIRKIESLKFNFPSNTFIKRNNSNDKQAFCLNQLRNEITFSPYFTCLIGGRGTGKSTIINLLGERLGEKTDFFKYNNLIVDGKKYDIELDSNELVTVSGTNEIEFVSQGKVERLAEGNELTKLIFYERIKEAESGFYDLDKEIESISTIIEATIKLLFDIQKNNQSLKEKNKEKSTTQNIIDSVNDDRYKEITNKISKIREEISSINISKSRYESLLSGIRSLLLEHIQNAVKNSYEIRINEILDSLKSLSEINIVDEDISVEYSNFKEIQERIDFLTKDFVAQNLKLKEFFQEKGMSEESIKDSQKANENLARINSEINQITLKIDRLKEDFKENTPKIESLSALNDSYHQLVEDNITVINRKLEVNNENVLDINFKFEYDNEHFKEILFKEFYDTFSDFHISGTSSSQVKEVLFLIEPDEKLLGFDHKTFLSKIESEIDLMGKSRANNYVKIILDVFASNINFIVYKLMLRKHLYSLSRFIKVNGFYGSRELQNCSFGQRCTAVVVTLLMTGVKPLIIDEPEAHLDNRLIADYLVDLIKTKKLDRQIIFATHNSNFVINGDSELIHILEIPLSDIFTNITSTPIENLSNRDKLLKLEGGRDAFLTREQKYGIH